MMARAGVLLACILLLPWPAGAQGIGDTAAREKERRSKEAQAGGNKAAEPATYTNDDLPGSKAPAKKEEGQGTASQAQPAAGTPAEPSSPGPLAERAAAEKEYQDKVDAAQKDVDELEAKVRDLQASLNPMSSTYIYGRTGGADANDEMRVRNELQGTEARLARRSRRRRTTSRSSSWAAGRRARPTQVHPSASTPPWPTS